MRAKLKVWVDLRHRISHVACAAVLTVLALSGCGQDKPANSIPAPRSGTQNEASVVFFDGDVFDQNFADELQQGTPQVHVNFGGPTPLNAFPPRMNTWLAAVKNSSGTVSLADPDHPAATRGMFGIGMIFDIIDAVQTYQARQAQARRMALAASYNAKIIYDSANGMAREVLFIRRPDAQAGTRE